MIIVCELYVLKSSGLSWQYMLAHTLRDIGYQSTYDDPDIWIKMITRTDGIGYHSLVLIYVDDILHLHNGNNGFMNDIRYIYMIKDGVGEPDIYLDANIQKVKWEDGSIAWSMTSWY